MIGKDNAPIGIDFGRCLGVDPTNTNTLVRAAFCDFPHIDEPLNAEDARYFSALNIDDTMEKLTEALKRANPELFANPELTELALRNLETLRATLIVVQECVRAGCTIRQMLAFFYRPITQKEFEFVDANPEHARPLADDNGFNRSWKVSLNPNNRLDQIQFRHNVRYEIEQIKNYPEPLFGIREQTVYDEINTYIPSTL